jgi:ribonuclease HI
MEEKSESFKEVKKLMERKRYMKWKWIKERKK